ncbi:Homoprotocatechuate catabolism bifunctional isomerase/decarboxylase [Legionella nautarum]|uniref:Homoprotocatechuate catabolism bifunctional isomerase/decarboxylase n=1 Tax=Legionella nautarum TaxID=45070 RepID=A0A0W0X3E0_9GAMM|nr:fumarylacetoacetate hydrolase family protein [Legionella nautarum]KTD39099.1 Homoprotocatechuate catabolism bifunctional isomerase/decarboxylase [Legionella nautarum]
MKQVFYTTKQAITVSNIFCIGRNYSDHIAELNNQPSGLPLVFLKPTSALMTENQLIQLPEFSNEVDYEAELLLLIGKEAKNISIEQALGVVSGYGIGLDLTARDLQAEAKAQGRPWTLAKGFDGAACISQFVPAETIENPLELCFEMKLNGVIRQRGFVQEMIFNLPYLIHYLSSKFTLQPGDLVFTGTPAGTGALQKGDRIELSLADKINAFFSVAS